MDKTKFLVRNIVHFQAARSVFKPDKKDNYRGCTPRISTVTNSILYLHQRYFGFREPGLCHLQKAPSITLKKLPVT